MMNLDGARMHDSLAKYKNPKKEEYDDQYPDGWSLSKPAPPRKFAEDEEESANANWDKTDDAKKKPMAKSQNNSEQESAPSRGGKEHWRAWQGGPYEISSHGRVRREGRILKPRQNPAGYVYYNLSMGDQGVTQMAAHEMVLKTFGGKVPQGVKNPVIEHKNNKKGDNHIENLQWGNIKSNTKDAYDSGNYKEKGKASPSNHKRLQQTNEPDYMKGKSESEKAKAKGLDNPRK